MKMYPPRWIRGMSLAALFVTLTAGVALAQDTLTVASPDGRNKVGVAVSSPPMHRATITPINRIGRINLDIDTLEFFSSFNIHQPGTPL